MEILLGKPGCDFMPPAPPPKTTLCWPGYGSTGNFVLNGCCYFVIPSICVACDTQKGDPNLIHRYSILSGPKLARDLSWVEDLGCDYFRYAARSFPLVSPSPILSHTRHAISTRALTRPWRAIIHLLLGIRVQPSKR